MPNLRFAEFLLSLVMPAERAPAVAGDLAESASGSFGLWLAVLRTLLSTALHQLRAAPMTVLRGALYVQVVNMAAGAVVSIAEVVGVFVLLSVTRRMESTMPYMVAGDALNGLLVAFFLGRYMLRRYGSNAIGVWVGAMVVRLLLLSVLGWGVRRLGIPLPNIPAYVGVLESLVLVLASLQLLVGIGYEQRSRRKASRA
jgi:hypothetical protein